MHKKYAVRWEVVRGKLYHIHHDNTRPDFKLNRSSRFEVNEIKNMLKRNEEVVLYFEKGSSILEFLPKYKDLVIA